MPSEQSFSPPPGSAGYESGLSSSASSIGYRPLRVAHLAENYRKRRDTHYYSYHSQPY
jgi:hypothetical protein